MLTPAIQAYGVGVVSVLIVFLVACLIVLAVDYHRWTGHQRAAAKRRHPAGSKLAPATAPHRRGRHEARPLDDMTTPAPIFRRRPL